MKQGTEETLDDFMTRLQFLVSKSFPKLGFENRESIAVPAFCKGLHVQHAAQLAAVESEGQVAKVMKIAASVTSFSARPYIRTSQTKRYNTKSNRNLTKVAREEQRDEQLGGEGDETEDWAEEAEVQDDGRFVATTNSLRPRDTFRGACASSAGQDLSVQVAEVRRGSGT